MGDAFKKLDSLSMAKNSVMFGVTFVSALTTVLFSSLVETVAEGLGKAQADSLHKTHTETHTKLLEGESNTAYKIAAGAGLKIG